jgi:2-dehydro-3-deoxygluconokinase
MKILCFGEIMLRLSPPDQLRLVQAQSFDVVYGGSEANVAVSLAQLGMQAAYATRVPDNELGRSALFALDRYGVNTQACVFGGERLGIYFLETGAGRRNSKVLYDRSNSGMATLAPGTIDWHQTFKDTTWLHWSGITPALSRQAAEATLEALQIARQYKIRVSCDLNYRDKLWKYGKPPVEIMPELMQLTDVLLGDQTAFEICLGACETDRDTLLKRLTTQFPGLEYIAISSREGHSASHNTYQGMLFDGTSIYESRSYELPHILDRIGSGDAFMAGLIFCLSRASQAPQEAVEFAAAAAALKHYIRGDFNLSTESEIRSLVAGNLGGRVSR